MNSPWTVKVIVAFIALSTTVLVIKTLMLFQYFSFMPGPILIRTAATAFGVALAVFGLRGLLRGSNGWRIFYVVCAVLGTLIFAFPIWALMTNRYYGAATFWRMGAMLAPQLFILWAFLLHGETVRFFKPVKADWAGPSSDADAELQQRLSKRLSPENNN